MRRGTKTEFRIPYNFSTLLKSYYKFGFLSKAPYVNMDIHKASGLHLDIFKLLAKAWTPSRPRLN